MACARGHWSRPAWRLPASRFPFGILITWVAPWPALPPQVGYRRLGHVVPLSDPRADECAPTPAVKDECMAEGPRQLLICSCEDSMPVEPGAVRRGCRGSAVTTAHQLC